MSLAVFNINDAGIQVSVDGDLVRTSPGIAVLDNGNLMTGEAASQHAKLLPRWTNTRFWSQLDTNPITNATSQVRHHADLAFAHLEELWTPLRSNASSAVFIVPGYYSNENLGMLLGIAKESGISVSGIADQSVIAASSLPLRKIALHLDIHLHSITLTRIDNNGMLERKAVKTVVETGLSTLRERWANIIGNQFVQSTRFDPMHDASSEQQLFNRLPDWIANLGNNSVQNFQLELDETEHTVAISNDNLLKACTPLYPQIVQAVRSEIPPGETASLLISHHFQGFPGLKQSLKLIDDVDLIDLTELKTISSAHLLRDQFTSDGGPISHVTSVEAGELIAADEDHESTLASHILKNNRAIPIGKGIALSDDLVACGDRDATCLLYPRNHQLILEPRGQIWVNGKVVESATVIQAGDSLQSGSVTATLITVAGDGQA